MQPIEEEPEYKFVYFKGDAPMLLPFNAENIQLHKPTTRHAGTRMCEISYLHEGVRIPFRLQTPRMHSPFPLESPCFGGETKKYKQFSLNFWGEEIRPDLVAFRNVLKSIDRQLLTILTANSKEWFSTPRNKKPKSRELLEEMYNYLIRDGYSVASNRQYPDTVNFKCAARGGLLATVFFDEEGGAIVDESELTFARSEAVAIVELGTLWISKSISPKFEAKQVQLFRDEAGFDKDYGFCETNWGGKQQQQQQHDDGVFDEFSGPMQILDKK